MSGPNLVVFTDLDGTLLDHDTYDHAPAHPALSALRARGVPLVLVTSKTLEEVEVLRRELKHEGPFIVENGGAIHVPAGYLADLPDTPRDGLHTIALGVPYARIRSVLERLRTEQGHRFEGFGDVDADVVAAWTGLSAEAAARAKARCWSEPIRPLDDHASLARLREALGREGLRLIRGGRFLSVQGPVDKGDAVRLLLSRMRESSGGATPTSAALGDSDNDLPMLNAVDIPIAIAPRSGRPRLRIAHPRLIEPAQPGPRGFRAGIETLLEQLGELEKDGTTRG